MSFYYIIAALLLAALMLFILVPLYLFRKTRINHNETISNPEIVKQRLVELTFEKQESLLAESDYREAVMETKLHLSEELPDEQLKANNKTGWLNLALSFAVFSILTVVVYMQVNHVTEVANWEDVKLQLPEMGQRIVVQGDNSVTQKELLNFALALRTKLSKEKDDAVGWLLLGRVLSSLRDYEGAILAFNKSLKVEPTRVGALFSLAQTLLVTDDSDNLFKAEQILIQLREITPQDNNVLGLLAVALTRKGDNQGAIDTWTLLQSQLEPGDRMLSTVEQQLVLLKSSSTDENNESEANTEIVVQVSVAPGVFEKLPGDGYIFVFVQDADSAMKMPAAVKKLALTKLDLSSVVTFSLSDADSMLQEFNLSNISKGRLIARISSDENVAVQTGDLQGELVIPVNHGLRSEHQLIIDKEIL